MQKPSTLQPKTENEITDVLQNRVEELEKEISFLYTVMRDVSYSMDQIEIQESIIDIILKFFPEIELCVFVLYDTRNNTINIRLKKNGEQKCIVNRIKIPFIIEDSTKWDEILTTIEWDEYSRTILGENKLRPSFITLASKERQLGFLMIQRFSEENYKEGRDWTLLNILARHFATTIENSQLYLLAITDELTELFNRRYFDKRFDREFERSLRQNRQLALLMMDVDRFKSINDKFGHTIGDKVLKEVGSVLKLLTSELVGRGISCRYGGDEFVVILPNTDKVNAEGIIEIIHQETAKRVIALNHGNNSESGKLNFTLTIGNSIFPDEAKNAAELLNNADKALYAIKTAKGVKRI